MFFVNVLKVLGIYDCDFIIIVNICVEKSYIFLRL